jgi:hypothetical protein
LQEAIAICIDLWRAAGNVVTVVFIPIALIASMVGLASVLAGAHHVRVWRSESLAAAVATSLIAWLLTLLAMGIACKEIHTGYGRSKRLVSSHIHSCFQARILFERLHTFSRSF